MGLFDFMKNDSSKKADSKKSTLTINTSIQSAEVVPIEKRIKGTAPTCDGLYPHEVLALSYAPKYYAIGKNDFAGFWWYRYGIKDMKKLLRSLEQRGYIQCGTVADTLALETLATLKDESKNHGLKSTGKKDALIKTLMENVPEQELSRKYSNRPYVLTALGTEILEKYEWIPYIHSHELEDLNIWNLTDIMQKPPYRSYRDEIWGYLNRQGVKHAHAGDYGLYRNTRFKMSEFLVEEEKFEGAFILLCEVCVYDLSGLSNSWRMEFLEIYAKSYFPYEKSLARTAPGIINRIVKYQKKLGWDDSTLRERISTEIPKYSLPFNLFTADEDTNIIMAEIAKDTKTLEKIYTVAEKRFRKTYKIKKK